MKSMLETLKNAWKVVDLRKKMIFTVVMLLIFRLGSAIPVPGIDPTKLQDALSGDIFSFMDIISGGALKNATIFAMSITPYINASIIMSLLTIAIPKLERLQKEGEEGRKVIQQFTRYLTIALAFLQAFALYFGLRSTLVEANFLSFLSITLTLTAGTAFLMWLGEQITEKGVGNGISLIIFAGIVSRGPVTAVSIYEMYKGGTFGTGILAILGVLAVIAVFLAVIVAVIWVNQAERRIPVQYAKRVVGRKMYGGQSTYIPIKVNLAGVIPIIFAMSIMAFPATIVSMFFANSDNGFVNMIKNSSSSIWYSVILAILIIFFTFFYTMVQFNPVEIANNLKKNGGFIPGVRPGKPTSDYLTSVLNRITWFGGLFLAVITLFPSIMGAIFKIDGIWFGGTSILILVGVAVETVTQIESQMVMRNYKGFLD